MNLVIDIGNTRIKVFVFKGNNVAAEETGNMLPASGLKKIFSKYAIEAAILSSVAATPGAITSYLRKHTWLLTLNPATPLPVKNLYRSKETLGNDRIANAAGAAMIFPSRNCLVIDAGTCVKYDFITKQGEYLGGAISPGLEMRFASLHDYTSRLPMVTPAKELRLTGRTTEESIRSGVQNGMLGEMEAAVSQYKKKYGVLKVILTGGDAHRFAHLFNFPIFAAPQLTATGLNEILQHNRPKK
jgi:type III pantothenate kinase